MRFGRQLAACLVILGLLSACTVVPLSSADHGGGSGSGSFDAAAYVDGIWASKVVPTIVDKGVDLSVLLPLLETDPQAADRQYGHQEGGGPYNFMVTGRGVVKSVAGGAAVVAVQAGARSVDVSLIVGSAITSTAVRDSVGFIQFADFLNQVEYADVSTALNKRVKTDVLAPIDQTKLAGATVHFWGAFTLTDPNLTGSGAVVIVPVKLDPAGG